MSPTTRILCALSLLAVVEAASAAHITDKLVVGMYAGPAEEGTPLQLLSSGTPLEVLQRKGGFSEVRLADDTRGWVASNYITEEKPAKAMLLETQARLRLMGMEVAALRAQQAAQGVELAPSGDLPPSAGEARLRRSLETAEARIAGLERELAGRPPAGAAQQELEALRGRVAQALELLGGAPALPPGQAEPAAQGPVGRYRSWIIAAIALLLGFGGGVAFVDHRMRRRHGGFRV